MIPVEFLIALMCSCILALSYFIDFKNRDVNTVCNFVLCSICAVAWCSILYSNYISRIDIESYILLSIIIQIVLLTLSLIVILLFLLVITWKETPDDTTNINEANYTPETLVSEKGVIVKLENKQTALCQLDGTGAFAIIHFDEPIKEGDIFAVTSIDAGRIYGKIIGTTDNMSDKQEMAQ